MANQRWKLPCLFVLGSAMFGVLPAQMQFEAHVGKQHLLGAPHCKSAVGDFDGDGDVDIVFADGGLYQLFLNDGTGRFTDETAGRMPTPSTSTCNMLLVGDVDGDLDLDIVLGGLDQGGSDANRLLLNDGTGRFTDVTASSLPATTGMAYAGALGDVDGDGDLDLVVGNSGLLGQFSQNELYLNDGHGVFTDVTATHLPVDVEGTNGVALGDVDGDGDLDIVLANGQQLPHLGQQNRLYLNDGSGHFVDETATRIPVANDYTIAVALFDMDGDLDLDLVFGNEEQDRLCRNDGSGHFTDVTSTSMPAWTGRVHSVAFGDTDGDGDLDLILGSLRGRLYENDGTGVFTDASTRFPEDEGWTGSIDFVDLDGDGDGDLSAGHLLFLNDGSGRYVCATRGLMPEIVPSAVALGDVDGDGAVDLVLARPVYWESIVLLNHGASGFGVGPSLPALGDDPESVALGDVDGDGDLDLAFGNRGQNRLFLNDGSAVFTDVTATNLPADDDWSRAIAFGDVDGDLDVDLVIGNDGVNELYLNDGTGVFTKAPTNVFPLHSADTYAIALVDIDADGDLDVVVAADGPNCVYRNQGRGAFILKILSPGQADWTSSLCVGDVDGDGMPDVLFGNDKNFIATSEQNRLYLNDGSGGLIDVTATHLPANLQLTGGVAFADIDEDGDLDVLEGNHGTWGSPSGPGVRQNHLYLNDGTGRFVDATSARLPDDQDYTYSVTVADLDDDGDVDVLFGALLYSNLLRHQNAPWLAQLNRTYELDFSVEPGLSPFFHVVVPLVGTGTLRIPLPPLGTLGLDPAQMVALSPAYVPPVVGRAVTSLRVPDLAALVGLTVYSQAFVLDVLGQGRFTAVISDRIIR